MSKYTIELPEKVEKELRERFKEDKLFWSKCKGSKATDNFEEYIAWFVEDYIQEIKESENMDD